MPGFLRKLAYPTFGAGRTQPDLPPFHPATVVCDWGAAGVLDIAAAKTGVVITGATGSGKTTGPGRSVALGYLSAGFGGVVLTMKPEEAAQWRGWIAEAGRESDLIEVDASGRYRFNFLAEEAARTSEGGGLTINICSLLTEVAGVLSRGAKGGSEQGGDQRFWNDALTHLLTNLVDLCLLARLPLTLRTLRELLDSAPLSVDQAQSASWRKASKCYQAIATAAGLAEHQGEDVRVTVEECATYFHSWAALSDKTRSTIVLMASMLFRPFLTRPLYRIFSTDTNLRPEDTFDGKLIVVNLPVQTYKTVGVFAGIVWKYCTQLAIMRRAERGDGSYLRPVFIYSDEAQNFISDFDYTYQAVARSAGGCTCYIFQNREALVANVGSEYKVDSLLANLQTKIFCQNTGETNTWASELLGERWLKIASTSVNRSGQEVSSNAGVSIAEQRRAFIEPSRFATLKRGGEANGFHVETVLFMGGRLFGNGEPFQLLTFDQR